VRPLRLRCGCRREAAHDHTCSRDAVASRRAGHHHDQWQRAPLSLPCKEEPRNGRQAWTWRRTGPRHAASTATGNGASCLNRLNCASFAIQAPQALLRSPIDADAFPCGRSCSSVPRAMGSEGGVRRSEDPHARARGDPATQGAGTRLAGAVGFARRVQPGPSPNRVLRRGPEGLPAAVSSSDGPARRAQHVRVRSDGRRLYPSCSTR